METAEIDKVGNAKLIENITLHSVSLTQLTKLKILTRLTKNQLKQFQ